MIDMIIALLIIIALVIFCKRFIYDDIVAYDKEIERRKEQWEQQEQKTEQWWQREFERDPRVFDHYPKVLERYPKLLERKQRREQIMITPEEKAELEKAKELLNKIDTRLREEYKVVDRRIRHAQLDDIEPSPEDLDLRFSLMNTANLLYKWPNEAPGCDNCAFMLEHNQRALADE